MIVVPPPPRVAEAISATVNGDKRTGYAFKINAAGARADGLINDPEHISSDWDGIWDARTTRTPNGWTAEIEIPSHTLNFTPGLRSWGLNLERTVAREQLVLRWASPTLDSFAGDMSRAGLLNGMEGLEQGRGLEIAPYIAGRSRVSAICAITGWKMAWSAAVSRAMLVVTTTSAAAGSYAVLNTCW